MATHYVNNADFLAAIKQYKIDVAQAAENGLPKPQVPNYIGECILKIANHLSYKPNFINYTYRDDMIGDGIENCLHRDTKIMTQEYGPVKIADIVGQTVKIKCVDGEWRPAVVKSYGSQKLYKYNFGAPNTKITPFTQHVIATANHRWLIKARVNSVGDIDWKDEVVDDLRVGDMLQNVPDVCEYPLSANGDIVPFTGHDFCEEDLPFTNTPKYIAGFIYKWWLTQGGKTKVSNGYQVTTIDAEIIEWLRDYAAYGGYQLTEVYYDNDQSLYQLTLTKNSQCETQVRSIEYFGEDEVFCVEEPVTNSFTLSNGILTGNCLMYIDNFNPERSSNPFAYFTQIIYYAFVRRIQKEKRQTVIKGKIFMEMPFDLFDIQEQDEDNQYTNAYVDFVQSNDVYTDVLNKEEQRKINKTKTKPTANLDDILDIE